METKGKRREAGRVEGLAQDLKDTRCRFISKEGGLSPAPMEDREVTVSDAG